MPRAYTKDEVVEQLLQHVRFMSLYWADLPDKTAEERCNGLAFSIMVMLDGGSSSLPAINLTLCPHESDKGYCIAEGEDYYEPGMVINDETMLHESLYKRKKDNL